MNFYQFKARVKRFYITHFTKQVRLEVSYTGVDTSEFYEIDPIIAETVRPCQSTGSGYGFGTRDLSFVGSKRAVVEATRKLKELERNDPMLQINVLNGIEDAEFMGIGY